MNWWKRMLSGSAVVLTVALGCGCGSSSGGDGLGGLDSRRLGYFPGSGNAGPGTGEPVPFSPGSRLVSLSISPSPLNLYRGQAQPLTIQGISADGNTIPLAGGSISFTTSPPNALDVSSTAVITPLAREDGILNVTATTPRGSISQAVPFSVRRRLFVTHWGDDTLRVLDAQTYTQVKSVALGGHPLAMVAHPATDRLWVGVGDGHGINVFNMADLDQAPTEIGSSLPSYGYYRSLFNPFNNSMLWSHIELAGTGGTLQGFEADSLDPLAGSPQMASQIRSLTLNDTGTLLLNTTRDTAGPGLQVRDPDTLMVLDTVLTEQIPFDLPLGLVYDRDNQCAYVGSEELVPPFSSRIITVDLTSSPSISAVTDLTLPRAGSMEIVGDRVFVSHFTSSAVSVYRTTSAGAPLLFERTLAVGANPANLTVDPTSNRLLVSSEGTNSLYVFDLATLDPIAGSPFTVGAGPATCVFEP